MATAPTALPPPPSASGDTGAPPPDAATSPGAGSPAPAVPAPGMNNAMKLLVGMIAGLQEIIKDYPAAQPDANDAAQAIRKVGLAVMKSQPTGEPMAPAVNG